MSRIMLLSACGAFLLASGCVPSSRYLEMRSKYEEEAAKNRQLADENNQLRSHVEGMRGTLIGKDIDINALRDKLGVLRGVGIWDKIGGPGVEMIEGRRGLRLSALNFAPGSASLSSRGRQVLGQVAAQLKSKGNVVLVVDGHTDTDPIRKSNNRSNWELSGKRAAAVVDYLVKARAIKGKNALLRGFGQHQPVKGDFNNKAKNRRVELFYIPIGKGGRPTGSSGRGARSLK
jgi:chemotaxis protein MotB